MGSELPSTGSPRQPARPWQFSLRQLLAATAVLAAFCSAVVYGGAPGALLFIVVFGIAITTVGIRRDRFGWRITGILLTLFCMLGLCSGGGTVYWDGRKTVPLEFRMVDSETDLPIAGARVRVRDVSSGPTPPSIPPAVPPPAGERDVEGTTDSDGNVLLACEFPASGTDTWFRHTANVHFLRFQYWLQASAPGHKTVLVQLCELTGKSRPLKDPVPPRMRIEMKPTGEEGP